MIRFDNGPPGGDYVRYIDELMTQRAASLVAATMSSNSDTVDRDAINRHRAATDGRKSPTTPLSNNPSNNLAQRASPLSPTAATAIASAMMTRDNERRVASVFSAIGLAAGALLILIGILGRSSNVLFIVGGIALVSWAIKRLGGRVAPPAATTSVDAFTAMPSQRTSSRIDVKG